jgi:hypothetical protein
MKMTITSIRPTKYLGQLSLNKLLCLLGTLEEEQTSSATTKRSLMQEGL